MRIAPGIHRIGRDPIVNAYLVDDGGEVTVIDAGGPRLWSMVPDELRSMGRSVDDVRGIVLTHGHVDHVGFAERARRDAGWRVLVHEADAALARQDVPNPGKGSPLSPGPTLRFGWWALRAGLLRVPALREVGTFADGTVLDLPGAPRVVHVPGHTPGSAVIHLPLHHAVMVGDAFVTYHPTTGQVGPRLAPFGADDTLAIASLSRVEDIDASLVLPGHGEPFEQGIGEAVRAVRRNEAGAAHLHRPRRPVLRR